MSQPRIRTLKPECWQDEKIGALSRDARLLFIGLITMADDEGRLRAQPSMLIGALFPWDEISPRKVSQWLRELEAQRLVIRYETGGKPYLAVRNWRRHQRINRPSRSSLPPPPDPRIATTDSLNGTCDERRRFTESSTARKGPLNESTPETAGPFNELARRRGSDPDQDLNPSPDPLPQAGRGSPSPASAPRQGNPKATGTNPRATGTNPRAVAKADRAAVAAQRQATALARLSKPEPAQSEAWLRFRDELQRAAPAVMWNLTLQTLTLTGVAGDELVLDAPADAWSRAEGHKTKIKEIGASMGLTLRLATADEHHGLAGKAGDGDDARR